VTVQFSPDSLHGAARMVARLHDELEVHDCVDGAACPDHCDAEAYKPLLLAELLRDLRPDAPVFVADVACEIVNCWVEDRMIEEGAGVAEYLEPANDAVARLRLVDANLGDTDTRRTLTGIWDARLPHTDQADPWEAVRARVNEQLDADLPSLLAKAELLAKLFALRAEPREPVPLGDLYAVLHDEYGLARPETEPRARARP